MITTENIKNLLRTIIEYHEDEARRLYKEPATADNVEEIKINYIHAYDFKGVLKMLEDPDAFQATKAEYQEKKKNQAARELSK